MNTAQRKHNKRTKKAAAKKRISRKKKKDTYKGIFSNVFIWALVIINVFLIASFSSRFLDEDSSRAEGNVRRPDGTNVTVSASDTAIVPGSQLTVEILNGCGVPGVAAKVENYLRHQSCDVVATGNYQTYDVGKTFLIDRQHSGMVFANEVAQKLKLPLNSHTVVPMMSPERQVQVTVVIGKDYKKLAPFKNRR